MLICLNGCQKGPLGIHVLPYCDDEEQCEGLIIKEIVKGGRIDKDGRFAVGDRIIEVNDQTLLNVNFETAQYLISEALKDKELKLNIVKNLRKKQMNYNLPSSSIKKTELSLNQNNDKEFDTKCNEQLVDVNNINIMKDSVKKINEEKFNVFKNNKLFDLEVNQEFLPYNEVSPDDYDESLKSNSNFCSNSLKRIGKKYHIKLVKGIKGLGFTITTRDNQVGQFPIYIKTILPVGVAKDDGNLKQGDRLLEVNGIEMNNKSHEEALKVLKEIEIGQTVELVVSRQENVNKAYMSFNQEQENTIPKLPRQLPSDKVESNQNDLKKAREILSFNIPLNDTGSAGLGVNVKGKTSTSSSKSKTTDLGIFVKSIFHGGAAFKDGRLKPNDQLLSINGISLLNLNNEDAMKTLRRVLINNEGIKLASNSINLVIARIHNDKNDSNFTAFTTNDEIYDTFGTKPLEIDHQRNISMISTDSMKLNFYEQNYQHSDTQSSLDKNSKNSTSEPNDFISSNFNELYDLNKKNCTYDRLPSKDSLTNSTGYTISTPVKTSMKSDFTNSDVKDLSMYKLTNHSNRTDVLIENDDQENNDPNVFRMNKFFKTANFEENLESSLNKSKDSQIMNLSNVTNQLSINDDEEINFNFQRDGFGRQSMSEKRHAQLEAKNTDTFKRNKKKKSNQQSKDDQANELNFFDSENQDEEIKNNTQNFFDISKTSMTEEKNQKTFVKTIDNFDEIRNSKRLPRFPAACCCFTEQSFSQSSRSSCPLHSSSQQTSPKTETTNSFTNNYDFSNSKYSNKNSMYNKNFPVANSIPQSVDYLSHNQNRFSQLNSNNYINFYSNYLSKNNVENNVQSNVGQYGQWLGMKKSSSLESLQTLMHEVKKENVVSSTNLQYNTLSKPLNKVSRNRNTNESFRTAIDKSYEDYIENLTMETVKEEVGDSGLSVTPSSQKPIQSYNADKNSKNNYEQSSKPSSTSIGTVLSNGANDISDDEIGLIRRRSTGSSKKKIGLLRTLFRFGSKKFKDKQQLKTNSNTQTVNKELEEEVEKMRARKAALYEQELIQEYHKRLLDQQNFQRIVNQQRQAQQNNSINNSMKIKSQDVNQDNIYLMRNEINNMNYQTYSKPTQQIRYNKPLSNFDSLVRQNTKIDYLQNRNELENQRPKSTYSRPNSSFENNFLVNSNQNNYFYYNNNLNNISRKSFIMNGNSQLNNPPLSNFKDNSLQAYETVHNRNHSYDRKDAMQRPGSRVGIVDPDNEFNQYVIVVRRSSMHQKELNRPYV